MQSPPLRIQILLADVLLSNVHLRTNAVLDTGEVIDRLVRYRMLGLVRKVEVTHHTAKHQDGQHALVQHADHRGHQIQDEGHEQIAERVAESCQVDWDEDDEDEGLE